VKRSLIVECTLSEDAGEAARYGLNSPFRFMKFDFVLQ
jgi:hypothetical protein